MTLVVAALLLLLPNFALSVHSAEYKEWRLVGEKGGGPCTNATDCYLNGVCQASKCVCDDAWTGPQCGAFHVLLGVGHPQYGLVYPNQQNVTSWGASVTYSTHDSLYHLLVFEVAYHCGMTVWAHNGWIRHAVSPTIDGVYEPREIVMGILASNPKIIDATASGGPYFLVHICDGVPVAYPIWTNCTEGYTPPGPPTEALRPKYKFGAGQSPPPRKPVYGTVDGQLVTLWRVPYTYNFNGTWLWANVSCVVDSQNGTCVFDNPAGWVDPDGTAWMNYVIRGDHESGMYGFGLARANSWLGPFVPLSGLWDLPLLSSGNSTWRNCEDSTLYRDQRGNFHMIFHYFGNKSPLDNSDHGGHAFAGPDGMNWTFQPGDAYDMRPSYTDDTTSSFEMRQRPFVVISPKTGQPTWLVTSVALDYNRPYPPECIEGMSTFAPCDRTYTHIVPLWPGHS